MNSSTISHRIVANSQALAAAEQILYDFLLESVQEESPEELIDNFRRLFIEGRNYGDAKVYSALDLLVKSKNIDEKFNFFFNRCCYILVNRWQMTPQMQTAIPEFVSVFENLEAPRCGHNSTPLRVKQLVKNFLETDQYLKLQRIAGIIAAKSNNNSVGGLIDRYPYLYDHCLLSDDSSREHIETVKTIKSKAKKNFEVNISRYVTYKVRMAEINSSGQLHPEQIARIIQPVSNPTLLSDKELNRSLKQFVGNIENGYTYKGLSHEFLAQTANIQTFKAFKRELYEYLLGSIEPPYGKGQFNRKITQILENTLPQWDDQIPSEFLVTRTSSQLLNFLIIESASQPEHYVFMDMITNMGVTKTIGLLLKIVLVSNRIKPYLEKRFGILFNHYESFSSDGVPWLVKALENLQIALSVHFGKADISGLRRFNKS